MMGSNHNHTGVMEGGDPPGFSCVDMTDLRDRRGRKENGLVELTKKFIDLLKEAEN